MTDEQKLAVKKFLYGVKAAVMTMDIDSMSDSALKEVYDGFLTLMDATAESASS